MYKLYIHSKIAKIDQMKDAIPDEKRHCVGHDLNCVVGRIYASEATKRNSISKSIPGLYNLLYYM